MVITRTLKEDAMFGLLRVLLTIALIILQCWYFIRILERLFQGLYAELIRHRKSSYIERMTDYVRERYFEKASLYGLFFSIVVILLCLVWGFYLLLGRSLVYCAICFVMWTFFRRVYANMEKDLVKTQQVLGKS